MLTIQELFSLLSEADKVDLTRVGEEALIESIQVLTLADPSNLFITSLWVRLKSPPSMAASLDNRGEFEFEMDLVAITKRVLKFKGFTSVGATTLWFVILYIFPSNIKFKAKVQSLLISTQT